MRTLRARPVLSTMPAELSPGRRRPCPATARTDYRGDHGRRLVYPQRGLGLRHAGRRGVGEGPRLVALVAAKPKTAVPLPKTRASSSSTGTACPARQRTRRTSSRSAATSRSQPPNNLPANAPSAGLLPPKVTSTRASLAPEAGGEEARHPRRVSRTSVAVPRSTWRQRADARERRHDRARGWARCSTGRSEPVPGHRTPERYAARRARRTRGAHPARACDEGPEAGFRWPAQASRPSSSSASQLSDAATVHSTSTPCCEDTRPSASRSVHGER